MTISALGNLSANTISQAIQRPPEARESGPDRDGDADDAKPVAPAATVNLHGQTVGQQISVTA